MTKLVKGYVGWWLPETERVRLLAEFPQQFSTLVAHHCTLKFGVDASYDLPDETHAQVVGEAIDPTGVQALVLRIGGTTSRPGGGIYHITWSLAPGRKPVESNKVIEKLGWRPAGPVDVSLVPKFFPQGS
jgi:hypothetical protein